MIKMAKKKKCNFTKTYTDPFRLTSDTWRCATKIQKEKLLDVLGLHKSFAVTKDIPEMVKRGGSIAAKSILELQKSYLKNKGRKVRIKWN